MKTSILTRFLRFVAPWLRLSRVTSTAPRMAVEMNTVITAAMAMTQLRRMEPNASERKKLKRIAHLFGDLVVAAAALVAHEASGRDLQDAPAHAVDHGAVVGGDHHGGARAVDADQELHDACLLYTSDAADDLLCVDLGGRRIIKKKKKK